MNRKSKYDYLLSEKENIIRMYIKERKSSIDIGKIYNIKPSAVCYLLNKFNIERRDDKTKSKYILNHDYFENIDTEEKAYWLGFIFADGYVTNQDYVGIALAIKDKSHLEKFRNAIESNHIIHDYKCSETGFSRKDSYYSKIIFKSEKMCNDLKKHGCIKNKSLKLTFPNIEEKLIKHFIRGYFDGDGSLVLGKHTDFKICGTYEFLLEIINILNKNIENFDMKEKIYLKDIKILIKTIIILL